jgi:hypothetical protein
MDLWQFIGSYRANILQLVQEVSGALGAGVKSRSRLFRELDREMARYMDAMESVIHPALARDPPTRSYVADLEQEHEEIRHHFTELGAVKAKDSREWTRRFRALAFALEHYFSLQEHGAFTVARSTLETQAEALRKAFQREQIASLQAQRWHVPMGMVPARYGIPTGAALGTVVGVLALAIAATAWRFRPDADRGAPGRGAGGEEPWEVKHRSQENRAFREAHSAWLQ